jgi:hypothetical protein
MKVNKQAAAEKSLKPRGRLLIALAEFIAVGRDANVVDVALLCLGGLLDTAALCRRSRRPSGLWRDAIIEMLNKIDPDLGAETARPAPAGRARKLSPVPVRPARTGIPITESHANL